MGAAGQPLLPSQCPCRRGRQALQMSPPGTRWAEQFHPHHSHVPGQPPLLVNHSPMCPQSCWFFMAPAHMCRHTQAWHVCTQVWIHIHTVNKRGHGHTSVGTHVWTCEHMHMCGYTCVDTYTAGYTRVDTCTHKCGYTRVDTCEHAHMCGYTHMCGHMQTQAEYTHVWTHTDTHTHSELQIQGRAAPKGICEMG